jgi:hypothetical protein
MNGAMPRDSDEAQGLRIDIKYYEILWSPNPSLISSTTIRISSSRSLLPNFVINLIIWGKN